MFDLGAPKEIQYLYDARLPRRERERERERCPRFRASRFSGKKREIKLVTNNAPEKSTTTLRQKARSTVKKKEEEDDDENDENVVVNEDNETTEKKRRPHSYVGVFDPPVKTIIKDIKEAIKVSNEKNAQAHTGLSPQEVETRQKKLRGSSFKRRRAATRRS